MRSFVPTRKLAAAVAAAALSLTVVGSTVAVTSDSAGHAVKSAGASTTGHGVSTPTKAGSVTTISLAGHGVTQPGKKMTGHAIRV